MNNKLTPCLWFDSNGEEAARFYVSVFPNSKIIGDEDYPEGGEEITGKRAGSKMVINFELNGQPFMALNGGPNFKFSEAISFIIDCEDQKEVDYYWEKLTSEGGEESMCGWLKDKFGLSWQVVPKALNELMSDPNPEKAKQVMQAMLKMHKIDVSELQEAYDATT